jgi:hypothetical protein
MSSTKLKDKYRFYLEYPSAKERRKATRKNLGEHSGTVVAVILQDDGQPIGFYTQINQEGAVAWCYEAVTSVFDRENSPVCGSSVSVNYLRERCLRIAKDKALEIHPALEQYLLEGERLQEKYNLETY